MHIWAIRIHEARDVCRRGLELLGSTKAPARISLSIEMARAAAVAGDIEAALSIISEAHGIQSSQETAAQWTASESEAGMRYSAGHLMRAEEIASERHRLCESSGDLWGRASVVWVLANTILLLGRIGEAISFATEMLPLAERVGNWGSVYFCKNTLVERRLADGDFRGAIELARDSAEYGYLHQYEWSFMSEAELANIARLRGRIEEAVESCLRVIGREGARTVVSGYPRALLALTLAQAADTRTSEALKDALRFIPQHGHVSSLGACVALPVMVEAFAFAGQTEGAAALHPALEEVIAAGFVLAWSSLLTRTGAGMAAACARNWSRAEEHHRTAIHQADSMPHRVCQPIARYWYAEMLRDTSVCLQARYPPLFSVPARPTRTDDRAQPNAERSGTEFPLQPLPALADGHPPGGVAADGTKSGLSGLFRKPR